jgi:hypothetical protein
MESLTQILIEHNKRYPGMYVEDFIKLIHQSTFGPAHFSKGPNKKKLLKFLKKENENFEFYHGTPIIESIGNDYVRVSLLAVLKKEISETELINAFFVSMKESPKPDNALKLLFVEKLSILLGLIKDRVIKLDYVLSKAYIENYLKEGMQPMHHSDYYRTHYHPHYRVVKKIYLNL